MCVSSSPPSQRVLPEVKPVHFEGLFVKVILHEYKNIIVGNIYRPPESPADSVHSIISTAASIRQTGELILLGDFNINWLSSSSARERNIFNSAHVSRLIKEPTGIIA